MKITRVMMRNYKGIAEAELVLKDISYIRGRNRLGKTTVMDAVYDILTGKMSDGSAADNIRPMDEHGTDLNNDDIIREIDVDFDGAVSTIRKITRKKFAKNHQTGELVYKGNEDSYEVDGFPMKPTEYKKWLAERMDAEACNFCLNPKVFISQMQKNTATARKTLVKVSGYSPDEFIKRYPEFQDVVDALKGHSPDELKKVLNSTIKQATSRIQLAQSSIGMIKELQDNRQVVEDPEKKQLEENIIRFKACMDQKQQKLNAYLEDGSANIQDLLDKQSIIVRRANEDAMKNRVEAQKEIESLQSTILAMELEINQLCSEFKEATKQYKDNQAELQRLSLELMDIQNRDFEAEDICPTCGQKLPKETIRKARLEFNKKSAEAEQKTTDAITLVDTRIQSLKARLKRVQSAYKVKKASVDEFKAELAKRQESLSTLPEMKSVNDVPEAKAINHEIDNMKKRQQNIDILNNDIRTLDSQIFTAERRIKEIDFGIEMKQREAEADKKRMEDQKTELSRAQEEYGKAMAMLDRLKEYSMMSNKCLNDYVNSFFDHFKFSLFGETQSGEAYETCQMLVDGIPYGNGLNHGDMILCEIDLAVGFQKMMHANLPVFVDDSESLDEDRIPKIDNQLIILRRTDDKELVVTYG